jgi:hypothetical protein
LQRTRLLDAHECTVTRPEKELRIDQRVQQCAARRCIEIPETPGLRFRQSHAGHFEEFALNSPQHIVIRAA